MSIRTRSALSDTAAFLQDTLASAAIFTVVLTLTFVSFVFELTAFQFIFGSTFDGVVTPLVGTSLLVTMAFAFNAGKLALTWLMAELRRTGRAIQPATRTIRMAIIVNSALMTLLVVSFEITDPGAPDLLAKARADHSSVYQDERRAVLGDFAAEEQRLVEANDRIRDTAVTTYQERWTKLDADLKAESKIGGQEFAGARYQELKNRIETLDEAHATHLMNLAARLASDLDDLRADRRVALDALDERMNGGVSPATLSDFAGSAEAQNPALERFVATAQAVIDHEALTSQLVAIVLTLMITLIVEALPIVLLGGFLHLGRERQVSKPRPASANTPTGPALVHPIAAE